MATRFYFSNLAAPATLLPAYYSDWEQTGSAGRYMLVNKVAIGTRDTAQADATVTIPNTVTQDCLSRQFISEPLSVGGIISGAFTDIVRVGESDLLNNLTLYTVIRLTTTDGTHRSLLFAGSSDTEFPLTASVATRRNNAGGLTSQTAYPGDRLIVEIGARAAAPTAAGTATFRFGDSAATDFANTSGLTTDLNPWVEFAQNLFVGLPVNYQHISVGDGMSASERIK